MKASKWLTLFLLILMCFIALIQPVLAQSTQNAPN